MNVSIYWSKKIFLFHSKSVGGFGESVAGTPFCRGIQFLAILFYADFLFVFDIYKPYCVYYHKQDALLVSHSSSQNEEHILIALLFGIFSSFSYWFIFLSSKLMDWIPLSKIKGHNVCRCFCFAN